MIIDRVRGHAAYKKYRDEILALNPPEVVRNHLPPENLNIVWVAVADDDSNDDWETMILPAGTCGCSDNEILIEFATVQERDRLRSTIDKLGRILEYDVSHDDEE